MENEKEKVRQDFYTEISKKSDFKQSIEEYKKAFNRKKKVLPMNIKGNTEFNHFMSCLYDYNKLSKTIDKFLTVIKFIDMFNLEIPEFEKLKEVLETNGINITNNFGEIHNEMKNDKNLQEFFQNLKGVYLKQKGKEDILKKDIEVMESDFGIDKSIIKKYVDIEHKVNYKDKIKTEEIRKIEKERDKIEQTIRIIN